MVSCLTLLNRAHAIVDRHGGLSSTACGLSIAEEHIDKSLIASSFDTVTCERCRQEITRTESTPKQPTALQPKAVVVQLIEDVLNGRDADRLEMVLDSELVPRLPFTRVTRLHELFHEWCASIDELIAENETVVARYTARCVDRFGLLAPPLSRLEKPQTIIFKVTEGRITGITAVVDDFGIWDLSAS